jgi:hypothetical protein
MNDQIKQIMPEVRALGKIDSLGILFLHTFNLAANS